MPSDALPIPGECDAREFTHAALEDYAAFLLAHVEIWERRHARFGVAAPRARSLAGEACITSVRYFRSFYAEHASYILPLCMTLPATWRRN